MLKALGYNTSGLVWEGVRLSGQYTWWRCNYDYGFEYSTDSGLTWLPVVASTIYNIADSDTEYWLRGNGYSRSGDATMPVFSYITPTSTSVDKIRWQGSIMSLIDGKGEKKYSRSIDTYQFYRFFYGCSVWFVDSSVGFNTDMLILGYNALYRMFEGCYGGKLNSSSTISNLSWDMHLDFVSPMTLKEMFKDCHYLKDVHLYCDAWIGTPNSDNWLSFTQSWAIPNRIVSHGSLTTGTGGGQIPVGVHYGVPDNWTFVQADE